MPSAAKDLAVGGLRALLAVGGLFVALATVRTLATMPPPPPESDGFVHGMALLVGSVVTVLALGAAALGVALPSLLGQADAVGFGPRQRWLLRSAGWVGLGGLLVGLAVLLAVRFEFGVLVWLATVVLCVLVVCVAVAWRLGEAVVHLLARAADRL